MARFLKAMKGKANGNHMLIIDKKVIQRTHAPDGKMVDVRPLRKYINETLRASHECIFYNDVELSSHMTAFLNIPEPCFQELMTEIVLKVSLELFSNCCRGGEDAKQTTVAVFNMLAQYSWEVKVVLTLAAFGYVYRESKLSKVNTDLIRPLIDAMVKLTNTIFDVDDSRPENISSHIETAVSWTVGSVVVCTSHITSKLKSTLGHRLIGVDCKDYEYTEDDLSKLTETVVGMNNDLIQLLDTWCQSSIAERNKLGADGAEETKQFESNEENVTDPLPPEKEEEVTLLRETDQEKVTKRMSVYLNYRRSIVQLMGNLIGNSSFADKTNLEILDDLVKAKFLTKHSYDRFPWTSNLHFTLKNKINGS